jgi:hypothetical protein
MMTSYSPEALLDQAWQWRTEAATAADRAHGDECLRRAARYEQLVRQSIEISPIKQEPVALGSRR